MFGCIICKDEIKKSHNHQSQETVVWHHIDFHFLADLLDFIFFLVAHAAAKFANYPLAIFRQHG